MVRFHHYCSQRLKKKSCCAMGYPRSLETHYCHTVFLFLEQNKWFFSPVMYSRHAKFTDRPPCEFAVDRLELLITDELQSCGVEYRNASEGVSSSFLSPRRGESHRKWDLIATAVCKHAKITPDFLVSCRVCEEHAPEKEKTWERKTCISLL